MKKDSSRDTFQARKHYSRVLMQQGRVQVDADWNEQGDIIAHRAETAAGDVIGRCGAPMHAPAFHIVKDINDLTAEEQALPGNAVVPPGFAPPDFLISAGRYYVDGILCENERLTSYATQPDLPNAPAITDAGLYLIYADVWQRHLTALDDPSMREVALGGPDHATRAKTIWQIKHLFAGEGEGNCLTEVSDYDTLRAGSTGKLSARTTEEQGSTNVCIVPPGAGYRGLENQLYRIEIHHDGQAADVTGGGTLIPVTRVSGETNQVQYNSGTWSEGQAIEILSGDSGTSPMSGSFAVITAVDGTAKKLTLDIDVSAIGADELRVRAVGASYKWSRDNGSVVTAIENVDGREITVHDLGPDAVLGFKEGQWVEISNDILELSGRPGQLAKIVDIDPAINLITLNVAPAAIITSGGAMETAHPKLRAWDGVGAVKFLTGISTEHYLPVENGVEIRFFAGTYRTGDYWTIPARTATADAQSGNIEWPLDEADEPAALPPFGIRHHYCRLAMAQWDGSAFVSIEDCRTLFPPITELTTLVYVSGDGQEAMPGDPIPKPLEVGVFNGRWPVAGANVRFKTLDAGTLNGNGAEVLVPTTSEGIASCTWIPESNVAKTSQQVEARLLDAANNPTPAVVRFNGNLSIADQVFYDPGTCPTLQGQDTVQDALDKLSHLVSLYAISGNHQDGMRPGPLPEPLVVLAASPCGPASVKVKFEVISGGGTVSPAELTTGSNGLASTNWELGGASVRQEVEATLVDENAPSITPPAVIRFTATLRRATEVAYDPGCDFLKEAGVTTVAEAITALCERGADDEPGIRIEKVETGDGGELVNDTLVVVGRLARGLVISLTATPEGIVVGPPPNDPPTSFSFDTVAWKPTCFVTLDLPYPIGGDNQLWDIGGIVGYSPVILAASVSVKENTIVWQPTDMCRRWLGEIMFSRLNSAEITDRVLGHLTLKGNYIWAPSDSGELHLDGEVFGTLGDNGRTGLTFPSGNRRRGGDFEMWFWLMPPQVNPSGPSLDVGVLDGGIVVVTLRDAAGGPIPGFTVTLTSQTGVTRSVLTNAAGTARFAQIPPGTYTARVAIAGVTLEKTVTV